LWSTLQRLAPGDEAPLSGCAHAVCGGCTRLVDGKPRLACTTRLGAVTAPGRTLVVGELPAYAGAERPALGDPPAASHVGNGARLSGCGGSSWLGRWLQHWSTRSTETATPLLGAKGG
jgi:hypothetical protein